MDSTDPPKTTRRTSAIRNVTGLESTRRTRRLSSLTEESATNNTTNRNLNIKDAHISDLVNVQSLINIRSIYSQIQQEKKAKTSLDGRIRINICGDRYETYRTTLDFYPNTLLGNDKQRKYYYDENRNEYFFDRHRACFGAILYYYQSHGRLRRPNHVPLDVFLEEVLFFQLGREAFNQLRKDENITVITKLHLPKNPIRRYLWAIMEYPDYSKTAKIVHIISILMVLTLTIVLAIETLPQYADFHSLHCETQRNTTSPTYTNNRTDQSSSKDLYVCHAYFTSPFFFIQAICVSYFTIEFIIRILTTPSLWRFVKTLMNWIDLIAIIPFYITLGIYLTDRKDKVKTDTYAGLRFLLTIRLLQVFKFVRIFKNVKSLHVFVKTVRQSLLDFFIMIIIITAIGFFLGATAYYVENSSLNKTFNSIFTATYWGIITIASVGYGDITPITPMGRIVSCICALFGAATMGMLVSVLVGRYERVYVRTVFIDEAVIDFFDYPNDENDDINSQELNQSLEQQTSSQIEDVDIQTKANVINDNNTLKTPSTPFGQYRENPMKSIGSPTHFIIGYVKNENREIPNNLIEKVNSIIANKQTPGNNISVNIVSDQNIQESLPFDVQCQLESSSDEESADNDDNESLTEIRHGFKSQGSVLKTFQRCESETDDELKNIEIISNEILTNKKIV
ncbi:unnamed protein product [Rotaria sp. Silwood1]|nr:unnamed protein product [Rotaria sp. Silwood1]CAF1133939.1 unnamed protein product [Rotaria sp. Silwood1]CAF1216484.1 unnamed protein product [Rotaria sp. Silwood1]CAF3451008.1 unnamed protein product [Rotaria sp. Silwood1]CAF3484286.1 unnamed protein product [Rotaria sp. Silwood1]